MSVELDQAGLRRVLDAIAAVKDELRTELPAAECFECGQDVPVTGDVSWPVDGPDPIDELRRLPGARPHIDIVEARLHALIPPALEEGCGLCGDYECDCDDWNLHAFLVAAVEARFAEYGYTGGRSLARLAVEVLREGARREPTVGQLGLCDGAPDVDAMRWTPPTHNDPAQEG